MAKSRPSVSPRLAEQAQSLIESVLALCRLQAAEPPLQAFLDQTVELVSRVTGVTKIKVMQYRPHQGDLLVVAGTGWNEGVVGRATLPIDVSSPPGRVIQTGRSSTIENFDEDVDYKLSPLLRNHDVKSLINVPVKADGAVWGVLEADSEQPCRFSEELSNYLKTVAYMIGMAVQRDERRRAAEDAQADVSREVARHEMLITEMHHRVKNNFQTVISTLLIQRRRSQSEETKQVLQTMSNRVMAISLAHDQLDPRQSAQSVSISRYLGALCRTLGQLAEEVVVETDFDEGELPVESAVALGLVVNELVTNSMKHAFDGAGRVTVTFRTGLAEREGSLAVADDGKGMTEAKRDGSSGTMLVEALAKQLRGRIERESPKRGTVVRICFPLP